MQGHARLGDGTRGRGAGAGARAARRVQMQAFPSTEAGAEVLEPVRATYRQTELEVGERKRPKGFFGYSEAKRFSFDKPDLVISGRSSLNPTTNQFQQ